jgi:hypothetical protein
MPPALYDVILTGQIVTGHDPQTVIASLARLMKRDTKIIVDLLQRDGQIIKRQVDAQTGQAFLRALKKIGVVSRLVPTKPASIRKPSQVIGAAPVDDANLPLRIIAPPLRPADVAYAPIQANRISGVPGGLDVNRIDTPPIRFEALGLLGVHQTDDADKVFILIFCLGQKRPYLCDANRIIFSDFPGTKATSVTASLRHFVRFAGRHHPALCLDPPTAEFLQGRPPAILEIDLVRFTTTMAQALASERDVLPA